MRIIERKGRHIVVAQFRTDGIRIWKQESVDGAEWRAGFDIFDRRQYTGAVESSQGCNASRSPMRTRRPSC